MLCVHRDSATGNSSMIRAYLQKLWRNFASTSLLLFLSIKCNYCGTLLDCETCMFASLPPDFHFASYLPTWLFYLSSSPAPQQNPPVLHQHRLRPCRSLQVPHRSRPPSGDGSRHHAPSELSRLDLTPRQHLSYHIPSTANHSTWWKKTFSQGSHFSGMTKFLDFSRIFFPHLSSTF